MVQDPYGPHHAYDGSIFMRLTAPSRFAFWITHRRGDDASLLCDRGAEIVTVSVHSLRVGDAAQQRHYLVWDVCAAIFGGSHEAKDGVDARSGGLRSW